MHELSRGMRAEVLTGSLDENIQALVTHSRDIFIC